MTEPALLSLDLDKRSLALLRRIERGIARDAAYVALVNLFQREGLRTAGHITKNLLSGQLLNRRTGNLARSITGVGLRVSGVPAMRVGVFRGPALKYAGPLEYGTKRWNPESPYPTIRPKPPNRALAMPVNDAVTPAGVEKYGGPLNYPGKLHFIPFRDSGISQGAIGGLFNEKESAVAGIDMGRAKASYILLAKMDLKPRFYLRRGLRERLPAVASEVQKLLVGITRGAGR